MRDIDPKKAPNYIAKSEEFLEVAKFSLQNAKFNSAVASAIHSAVGALDALTASRKGKRVRAAILKCCHLSLEYFLHKSIGKFTVSLYR